MKTWFNKNKDGIALGSVLGIIAGCFLCFVGIIGAVIVIISFNVFCWCIID